MKAKDPVAHAPPLASGGPSQAAITRARRATGAQFLALGVLAGTWGAHIPSVKARYLLSDGMLSMVLLTAAVGALASLLMAGRVIARLGARRSAALAALAMTFLLGVMLEHASTALLLPAMVLFGASTSLFDVAINTEGSALESLAAHGIMSRLHGMFSIGGMIGAALVAWMLHVGVAPRMQLWLVGAVLAAVACLAARGMLETHSENTGANAHFAWPTGSLLVIGALILAGMTAEGVMYDWSVLYLKQEVHLPQSEAALGYATFSAAMAIARFRGDRLRARYSELSLLRVGAGIAALAMTIVLIAANRWVALAGFAAVGAGLAPVAPILYNAATRVQGVSRAAAIAAVTSIGYGGFLIGPALIGGIATATSLTMALGVVVLAAVVLACGVGSKTALLRG